MVQEGVPGEGHGQVTPAHGDDLCRGMPPPVWSIACLRRMLDHHISFDYFVPSFSSLFLFLPPSITRNKSFSKYWGSLTSDEDCFVVIWAAGLCGPQS